MLYAVIGAFIIGGVFLLGDAGGDPRSPGREGGDGGERRPRPRPGADHRRELLHRLRDHLPAGGLRRDLRLLPVDHGGHHPAVLRDVPRQHAALLQVRWRRSRPACTRRCGPASRSPCIAAIPFIQYSGAGIIAIAATGTIYFSYFLGNIVILRARARGWPRTSAPFRLGRWGMLVNILALIYGGAMIINFAWPRAVPFTNPKPDQTGGLLSFHIGFLNEIPILWTVFVFIVLIGAIYYFAAGRKKEFAPVVAPAGDDAPLVTGAGTRRTGERLTDAATVEAAQGAGAPGPPRHGRRRRAAGRGWRRDPGPGAAGDPARVGRHRVRPDRGLAGRGDRPRRLAPGDRMPSEQDPGRLVRGEPDDAAPGAGQARPARAGDPHRRTPGRHASSPSASWSRTAPPWPGSPSSCGGTGCSPGARVLFATQRLSRLRCRPPRSSCAEGDPVHEVRRVRLGDGRPIVLEQSLFPAALFPGLLQCRARRVLYELLEARYGQRPHRARESLEPVTAGVREAEALEVAEGAPLMLVERVAYAQTGQPVEFARDLFRGDRTRIVMWTSELAGVLLSCPSSRCRLRTVTPPQPAIQVQPVAAVLAGSGVAHVGVQRMPVEGGLERCRPSA